MILRHQMMTSSLNASVFEVKDLGRYTTVRLVLGCLQSGICFPSQRLTEVGSHDHRHTLSQLC